MWGLTSTKYSVVFRPSRHGAARAELLLFIDKLWIWKAHQTPEGLYFHCVLSAAIERNGGGAGEVQDGQPTPGTLSGSSSSVLRGQEEVKEDVGLVAH